MNPYGFQMGMPPQLYASQYQSLPNMGPMQQYGAMQLASSMINRGVITGMPLYSNDGNLLDAARSRFYDQQRMMAAAAAQSIDQQRLQTAMRMAVVGSGRDVSPQLDAAFGRIAGGLHGALSPGLTATPYGRQLLDMAAGGVSSQNMAASMMFMSSNQFGIATGGYGGNAAYAGAMGVNYANMMNSRNNLGLNNNYGMSSDSLAFTIDNLQRAGNYESGATIGAMLTSDAARRAVMANPASLSAYGDLIAAGGMDPAKIQASQANMRNANAMYKAEAEAARIDTALARNAIKNAVENKLGSGGIVDTANNVHDSLLDFGINSGALVGGEFVKKLVKGIRPGSASSAMDEGTRRLVVASMASHDLAFRDAKSAEILQEAHDSINGRISTAYKDTVYGRMSLEEQQAITNNAVGPGFDMQSAIDNIDSVMASGEQPSAFGKARAEAIKQKIDGLTEKFANTEAKRNEENIKAIAKAYGALRSFVAEAGGKVEDLNNLIGELGVFNSSSEINLKFADSLGSNVAGARALGYDLQSYGQMTQANAQMFSQLGYSEASFFANEATGADMRAQLAVGAMGGPRDFGAMTASQVGGRAARRAASFGISQTANNLAVVRRMLDSGIGVRNQTAVDQLKQLFSDVQSNSASEDQLSLITDRRKLFGLMSSAFADTSIGTLNYMANDRIANQEVIAKNNLLDNDVSRSVTKRRLINDPRGIGRLGRLVNGDFGLKIGRSQLAGLTGQVLDDFAALNGDREATTAAITTYLASADGFGGLDAERRGQLARRLVDTVNANMNANGMTITDVRNELYSSTKREAQAGRMKLDALRQSFGEFGKRDGFKGLMKGLMESDADTADLAKSMALSAGFDIDDTEVKKTMKKFKAAADDFLSTYRDPLDQSAKQRFGKSYNDLSEEQRAELRKDSKFARKELLYNEISSMAANADTLTQEALAKEGAPSTGTKELQATFENVNIYLNGEIVARGAKSEEPVKSSSGGSLLTPDTKK